MYYVISDTHAASTVNLTGVILSESFLSKSHLPPESHFPHSTRVITAPVVFFWA